MITLKVKYTDGNEYTLSIPTSWNDVTWKQYVDLLNTLVNPEAGELHAAAILCGLDYDTICSLPLKSWQPISECLKFTDTPPTTEPYSNDFEFTDCNLRQIENVKDLLNTKDLHPYTNGALIVSIILFDNYDKDGLRQAKQKAKELELQSVCDVLPMVGFFFYCTGSRLYSHWLQHTGRHPALRDPLSLPCLVLPLLGALPAPQPAAPTHIRSP
jgi:hypothetical protein